MRVGLAKRVHSAPLAHIPFLPFTGLKVERGKPLIQTRDILNSAIASRRVMGSLNLLEEAPRMTSFWIRGFRCGVPAVDLCVFSRTQLSLTELCSPQRSYRPEAQYLSDFDNSCPCVPPCPASVDETQRSLLSCQPSTGRTSALISFLH